MTAASIAGEAGNLELLEMLWAAGAKTENPDASRLSGAARAGDVGRIKSLLKSGVDVNAVDPFTAHTALFDAAANGQPKAARVLVEAGASIAPPRKGAASPLLMACASISEGLTRGTKTKDDVPRYVETVRRLIGAGAPVRISLWGQTPIELARSAK